jgi:hypothetical protein
VEGQEFFGKIYTNPKITTPKPQDGALESRVSQKRRRNLPQSAAKIRYSAIIKDASRRCTVAVRFAQR